MADLHRLGLTWLVLACLVLAWPGQARADTTSTTKAEAYNKATAQAESDRIINLNAYNTCVTNNGGNTSVCGNRNYRFTITDESPTTKRYKLTECVDGASNAGSPVSCASAYHAWTQAEADAACSFLTGQAPNDLTCTGPSCRFWASTSTERNVCISGVGTAGCSATGGLTVAWFDPTLSLWGVQLYDVKYTGTACTPTAATPAPSTGTGTGTMTASPDDHVGKCPGTVNGTTVWVDCTWTKTEDTKKTTNGDNSGTTNKETTECKNGICTSTVQGTVTSSTGTTSTSTSTTTASQGTYCKDHPQDPQCGDISSWGGSCTAGFQCNGDAVMCAAAKGVWEQKCALVDGTSAERTKYENAKAAEASGTVPGLTTTTVAITSASFDTSNALGVTGSCALTRTVTVWGHPVSLPFDQVCDALQRLGQVLMLVGFLLAIRIVGKGD